MTHPHPGTNGAAPAAGTGPPPAPGQGPSQVRRAARQIGGLLTRLGGADPAILAMARDSGRSRFIQMGLVLLSTAGLALLSMSFALSAGLDLHPAIAVLGGVVWAFIILNLDRMLILNLDLRGGYLRVLATIAPRIALAMLLGVVISTPLVLQVFQVEIQKQIAETKTQDETRLGTELQSTATGVQLEEIRSQIRTNEAILRGEMPPVATPDVKAQEEYLQQAETKLTTLRASSDQAYRRWQCELYGSSCEESSDRPGNGNLARAREREYNEALAQTKQAKQAVNETTAALDAARKNAEAQSADALVTAQAEANRVLPGLKQREAELQKQYDSRFDDRTERVDQNDGLLAQIVALNDLSKGNRQARLTHLSVGLLFFMIELLPVLTKIMTSAGPPSLYERIREEVENRRFDDANSDLRLSAQERDDQEHRAVAEARKRQDIDDDMIEHERDLGFRANRRVAKEMENVLEVALADWAQKVQQTLHRAAPAADDAAARGGGPASNGSAKLPGVPFVPAQVEGSNGAGGRHRAGSTNGAGGAEDAEPVDESTSQITVRSHFNVPKGDNL